MNVRTLMRRAAQHYSGYEAVVHNETRLTFAQAWQRGVRLANGLLAMGLKPGDRVGVLEDNSVEAADLFQAAAIANLVRVPLYRAMAAPPIPICSNIPIAGFCWLARIMPMKLMGSQKSLWLWNVFLFAMMVTSAG